MFECHDAKDEAFRQMKLKNSTSSLNNGFVHGRYRRPHGMFKVDGHHNQSQISRSRLLQERKSLDNHQRFYVNGRCEERLDMLEN
jgi:hypothetical protein